ncbi:MAG: DUF4190 domain-containing protein [Aeromicrobium sp.]|uniref:DUF4190 domain-containing protein n=1 Tax=Aeromicrobium sp. TaxID=1871063 RepID=UPI0039E4356D
MSDPGQQPPTDPYRPEAPYQPQPPYGAAAPQGQPTPPPQNPYGAPQQPPYGAAPQPMFPPPAGPLVPMQPQAQTSMILGIIGLASAAILCGLLLFLSPVAWIMGAKAVKEIDASGGQLRGRSEAQTGMVTGIIGTVLLILGVLALIGFIVLAIVVDESTDDYYYDSVSMLLNWIG